MRKEPIRQARLRVKEETSTSRTSASERQITRSPGTRQLAFLTCTGQERKNTFFREILGKLPQLGGERQPADSDTFGSLPASLYEIVRACGF